MNEHRGREYEILESLLTQNESVMVHVAERRLGGARLLEPAHAFATNKRIIIIRRGVLGFHHDFKIISYSNITEIILEHGIRYSRVHFTLQGEAASEEQKKWLIGLDYKEALELIKFVNSIIEKPVQESRA
ncbi:MAG: PH domain-containing protein [Candidatus Micrarchaeota archaeon]|nr:PH domain-containing protein [Candidatus Micrarchaeota archaeon]